MNVYGKLGISALKILYVHLRPFYIPVKIMSFFLLHMSKDLKRFRKTVIIITNNEKRRHRLF